LYPAYNHGQTAVIRDTNQCKVTTVVSGIQSQPDCCDMWHKSSYNSLLWM